MPYWIHIMLLLRYHIPQIRITLHYIVCDGGVGDCGEVTAGTFNLHAFSTAVVKHFIVAVAFGFGNEIDVFDVGSL